MQSVGLLIGGATRAASSGATFDRRNPLTGEVFSRAAAATVDDADAAVTAAQAAFPAWAAMLPGQRREKLLKAAELLQQKADEFTTLGMNEVGGSRGWYTFNVKLAAGMLRDAAGMTTQITGDIIPSDMPGSFSMAVRQPAGVVLGIAPWNAPVILGVRALAMPLACGNTVVLKSSEACPALHRLIGTALQEAGLGDGVVNVISNAPEDAPQIVERLIANPHVRRVNFTGSTNVGRVVARLSATNLKPALLELGGKAPMLVLKDADLDAAVAAAAFAAFFNQGQICMSTERIIVDAAIAEEFVAKLTAKVSTLRAGSPFDPSSELGSMVSAEAAARIQDLVQDAADKGAAIMCGNHVKGPIAQPTVIDHVRPCMRLYAEESFGPVASIIRAEDEEEAIRIANDSPYGLSASIFSRDVSRAMRLSARIHSGICHINGPTVHDEAQIPFGGVGDSGYGRFGSKASIHEFTDLRWITIQTTDRHYPI